MLRTSLKPLYLTARRIFLRAFIHPGSCPDIPGSPDSMLLILDRRLGDVSLAIPVIRTLRQAHSTARLGMVASGNLHGLLQWACSPDMLFDYSDAPRIVQTKWEIAIDLTTDYHLEPARLASRTGAPVRIGYDIGGRGRYFNLPVPFDPAIHTQKLYARVLTLFGIDFRAETLPHATNRKPAAVAIHPGAHHPTQQWPPEYFAELIRRIHAGGEPVIVIGADSERKLVERIVELAGPGAKAVITRDVMDFVATLRDSDLLICNNSGPLHLAGLLGVPALSFMGPTVKSRWWPVDPSAVVLRRDELPCIGCNLGYCKIQTHDCMRLIKPDEAYAAYLRCVKMPR